MKKYLITILTVICIACLGFAAACTDNEPKTEDKYYTLTFSVPDGVTVESEAKSGAKVLEGYEITFTLKLDENAEGEAVVTANGTAVTPNESGVYSFKMQQDTDVEITGIVVRGAAVIKFDNGNSYFVGFLDLEGNTLTELQVSSGETVKFKTHVSVYYDGFDYNVVVGANNVLKADSEGVYSFTATGSAIVTFNGLPEDLTSKSFIGRDDGNGSADNPFIIRTPLDLYTLSYLVGDGYEAGGSEIYHLGYYSLANDIDMRGEKLFVIGDGRRASSIFAGVFDGHGHTISNYYMDNVVIDQTIYQPVNLATVGLFGYMVAANNSPTGIYNLNIKDFSVSVDGSRLSTSVSVGGLIGLGVGVTVSNCTVNGTLTVDANSEYFGYAGGIMGLQQSAYSEESGMRYLSVIQSSSSEVTIMGTSGYVLAAGGITGYVYSQESRSTAAILNCYSNSTVSGAMRAGGIAGMVNPYSSVKNCYSTGYCEADSSFELRPGLEQYAYSYAGGIAGFGEYGSIISDSYSTAECVAYSQVANRNNADGVLGGRESKDEIYLHTEPSLVYNCYSTRDTVYGQKISSVSDAFLKNTLLWDEQDWRFKGDGKPVTEQEEKTKTFTVNTVIVNSGNSVEALQVTDVYIPVASWYLNENGISEYLKDGNLRTYGYYFDRELTQRVPYGYIPTHDITLYTEYVDYSDVTGTYYLTSDDSGAYFTLDGDGYLIYREGAVNCVSTYYYDGERLVLENTFFAILINEEFGFYTYVAKLDGSVMVIYAREDEYSYLEDNQVVTVPNYTEGKPLTAVKKLENFNFGSYYSDGGINYTFNPDGKGVIDNGSSTVEFTYVMNGNVITVSYSGTTYECNVENGNVTSFDGTPLSAYDAFKGVWEKASSAHMQYTFDGKGNYSYLYYGFDKNGAKIEKQTLNGTYTVNGGVLSFDGKTAQIKDGYLYIDGEKYSAENSFAGTWVYNSAKYNIEITLDGVSADGYGTGSIKYTANGSATNIDVNYEVMNVRGVLSVAIYYYYEGYGLLSFDPAKGTLTGNLYVDSVGDIVQNIRLCMYDDFRGVWNGEGGVFDGKEVMFNGLGNYNLSGSGDVMTVKGNVYVNNSLAGSYTLDGFTLTGTLVYNGKSYEIEYDIEAGVINVKADGENSVLTKPDSTEAN